MMELKILKNIGPLRKFLTFLMLGRSMILVVNSDITYQGKLNELYS
jgi:hypothetical protein